MSAYKAIANQINEDLTYAYKKKYPWVDSDDLNVHCPNLSSFFLFVGRIFLRCQKYKLAFNKFYDFQPLQNLKIDLLPAYISTMDDLSIKDCSASAVCSKSICNYMFITKYTHFNVASRGTYTVQLRQMEDQCKKQFVEIYQLKENVAVNINMNEPSYEAVEQYIKKYLNALKKLLSSQRKIYKIEREILHILTGQIDEIIFTKLDLFKSSMAQMFIKELVRIVNYYKKRSIVKVVIKDTVSQKLLHELNKSLVHHIKLLHSECKILDDVIILIDEVLFFIEEKDQLKEYYQSNRESSIREMFTQFLKRRRTVRSPKPKST